MEPDLQPGRPRHVSRPRWQGRLRWFGPAVLLSVLVVFAAVRCAAGSPWYASAAIGSPIYGVDFTCRQVEWYGDSCHRALTAVFEQLHVRYIRLSAYWDQIEPAQGVYDFSSLDWQLAEARHYGARVTLTVGMKAQRPPQYYLPSWLAAEQHIPDGSSPADNPAVAAAALAFVRATIAHEAGQPAIEYWQVENEPYVHFFSVAHNWSLPTWFINQEASVVRSTDPQHRPIVITNAGWLSTSKTWQRVLHTADILGEAVYTKQNLGPIPGLYIFPYDIGPLTPNLPKEAAAARRAGKGFWIDELQAEPYERASVDLRKSTSCDVPSISPELMAANIRLADRSGAQRVYLWGVEWWYNCLVRHGDARYWQLAKRTLASSDTTSHTAFR